MSAALLHTMCERIIGESATLIITSYHGREAHSMAIKLYLYNWIMFIYKI